MPVGIKWLSRKYPAPNPTQNSDPEIYKNFRLQKVKTKWGQTNDQIHITLDELIKKLQEIMRNIKKERDQFLAIKKTYNQANISGT